MGKIDLASVLWPSSLMFTTTWCDIRSWVRNGRCQYLGSFVGSRIWLRGRFRAQ